MKLFIKCIAGLLALSVMGLYSPRVSFCGSAKLFAQADQKKITRHEPKIKSVPEKDIPATATAADTGKKKKPNWLLIGAATILVVGLAAAAGGGGGGGGGGGDGGSDTGSIVVGW